MHNSLILVCKILLFKSKNKNYKKVLLRERKRHTVRRVASTCYAVPAGVPPPSILGPDLDVGYPILLMGVRHPADEEGCPIMLMGVPPIESG